MNTTEVQIKTWLRSNGKDREWLAAQLNTTKSVVDSWFSTRGFPKDRLAAIQELMEPEDSTSLIRIPFTDEEFQRAQQAARLVKEDDFQKYCQAAIAAQVSEDLQITPVPLKAAEDPNIYKI